VFVNSAMGAVVKAVEIPYVTFTGGTTTFEPLFEVLLLEKNGTLAAGAEVLNDHLKTVIDLIQNETITKLDAKYVFKTPPFFSIHHRYLAVLFEAIRTVIKVVSVIPVLMLDGEDGQKVADQAHESASMRGAAFQASALAHVVAVECVKSLGGYFQEFGHVMISAANLAINGMELLYDMSVRAAVGISSSEVYPQGNRLNTMGHCESKFSYDAHPVARVRNALIQFSKRYTNENVVMQEKLASSIRVVIDKKFLAVALAESLYALSLFYIYFFDGVLVLAAYSTNAILTLEKVSPDCITEFLRQADEKFVDVLTSLPNLVTSLLDVRDTQASGYSNLVCARTTHVNHIYSGSLKMYVYASQACDAQYISSDPKPGESPRRPKCNYRHDDITVQNAMCDRLIAFSDYNSNPLCGAGDAAIESIKTVYYLWHTLQEYYLGLLVGIWNCVRKGEGADFVQCASNVSETAIPPDIVFDLIECQSAEMSYRIFTFGISLMTPMFSAIYKSVGYPADGYYAGGILDGVQHVQAKPLECALATTMMSVNLPQ